jgi:hypothetical protein
LTTAARTALELKSSKTALDPRSCRRFVRYTSYVPVRSHPPPKRGCDRKVPLRQGATRKDDLGDADRGAPACYLMGTSEFRGLRPAVPGTSPGSPSLPPVTRQKPAVPHKPAK